MAARTFSSVTALLAADTPGVFTGTIDPLWTIAGKPNGGYLLAMLGRAASATGPHEHVVAASAHYLRSPDPGEVTIRTEVLRAGRSASQLRVRMLQDGVPCVEALITTSRLAADTEPHWAVGTPAPGTGSFDESHRVPGTNPMGTSIPIMEQVDLRIEPRSTGFAAGRPGGTGELYGWLALLDERTFDPISLLFAVDAFPPATFDIELTGWVPTLELTAYVRAMPAPGPVRVLQKAHLIDAQRVDEACWVWDSRGRVVAQCTQLAGIRLG